MSKVYEICEECLTLIDSRITLRLMGKKLDINGKCDGYIILKNVLCPSCSFKIEDEYKKWINV